MVRPFKVDSLNKVDTTRYREGDFFITNKSVGILIGGKIKPIPTSNPSMKNYVKKEEVESIVYEILKKGVENNE